MESNGYSKFSRNPSYRLAETKKLNYFFHRHPTKNPKESKIFLKSLSKKEKEKSLPRQVDLGQLKLVWNKSHLTNIY
tara:strand:+ start:637 stop:867 length:231 start_codon:yes stop_codon:yes gene_type:complete